MSVIRGTADQVEGQSVGLFSANNGSLLLRNINCNVAHLDAGGGAVHRHYERTCQAGNHNSFRGQEIEDYLRWNRSKRSLPLQTAC